MDWLRNGPHNGGGYTSFNPQPYSSRQVDTSSPVTTSSNRSPAQLRSFIARYSDCTAPVARSFRANSAPTAPIGPRLPESTIIPVINSAHPEPNTQHPMNRGIKTSSAPLLLTPPPSSDHGEDHSPISPLTIQSSTNSKASITLPCLRYPPYPRIPSPLSVERLMESEYGKHTIYGVTTDMLSDWQIQYPFVRESDHINYQYDASTLRMIIRCSPSPVHDSLQIFFQGRVSGALTSRLGIDKFMESVQMSCGSGFGGFTGEHNALSRKQPDASLQVDGYDFPTVVCESGWAEKMDDLIRDASLWLLHTDGQTSVVIVLAFTEVIRDLEPVDATNLSADLDPTDDGPDVSNGEVTGPETSQDTINDPEARSQTSSQKSSDNEDRPTEEERLLAGINAATNPRTLAASFLDLHLRGQLAKPLIGRVDATVHIFRANATYSEIEQSFTCVLLPAPVDSQNEMFTLTMEDLLGELAEEEGIDEEEMVDFPLDALRSVVQKQIPKMESMRAMDRAAVVLKSLGFWHEGETFAQSKRSRKKRRMN